MSKLRKAAKGRDCQVRVDGVCNFNPETTVLAHLGGGGMGAKRKDLFGAWACSACHDEIDRRTQYFNRYDAIYYHLMGVIRTQEILLKEGLISA